MNGSVIAKNRYV